MPARGPRNAQHEFTNFHPHTHLSSSKNNGIAINRYDLSVKRSCVSRFNALEVQFHRHGDGTVEMLMRLTFHADVLTGRGFFS